MDEKNEWDDIFKDKEFLQQIGKYLDDSMKADPNDYKINKPQWNKMMKMIEYFVEIFPATGKDFKPDHIIPSIGSGCVTIIFRLASLDTPLDIVEFTDALLCANRVVFDSNTDGNVCIEAVVSKVFIPKDEEEHEVLC